MMPDLLFTEKGALGFITLNRPKALNALTLDMIVALYQQLLVWQQKEEIKAIVISAVAGSAFCAGGDVRSLYQQRGLHAQQVAFFEHEYRLNHLIHYLKKPYIALLDGITMGGGVGISLHGSHPIASERFVFAMPETAIGFFPDIGASHLLTRCPSYIGWYAGLTGCRLQAQEAHYAGLIKHKMSSSRMPEFVDALQHIQWSHDPFADVDACLAEYEDSSTSAFTHSTMINECFSHQSVEAILDALLSHAALQAQEIAAQLMQKAPLSLKVTLKQLQQAPSLSLAQCLTMDYNLVSHFMRGTDFYEGVRALLVDKDKNPQWKPAVLEEVSSCLVDGYFETVTSPLQFNHLETK
ncbi:MAG: 3-hydroxyisobutyryl-CoA hydrolase [Legionella sp.]|nr:MAG: 3-hydroxyisobutyryl-CoA hydrolase [Legionella sp.]PJD99611.1 MAG: 3-hydroxyisobutyryl-CoA hydrolase [Legionella sp.]